MTGIVKKFDESRGYGFIQRDGELDSEIFFHYTEIVTSGFKTIAVGARVKFKLYEIEGRFQAKEVEEIE